MSTTEPVIDLADEDRVRFAIVSDTHGFLDPRVAEAVARHDCAVHAGDVGNAGVLEALRPLWGRVYAVRGNNDVPKKWPANERRILDSLPETVILALPGGLLAVVHGDRVGRPSERHRKLRKRFDNARAVVFGHSHHRCVDKSARPWVLNPGAAGRARAYGGPGLLTLTATRKRWMVRGLVFAPLGPPNRTKPRS